MAKASKIVETSRNGNCPAGFTLEGDVKTDQGETIPDGMVGIRAYTISEDAETLAQIELVYGEGVLVAPEDLILELADHIRAARAARG